MNDDDENTIIDILLAVFCAITITIMVGFFFTGLDKEISRQEFIAEDNCDKYGVAMNRLFEEEVCHGIAGKGELK